MGWWSGCFGGHLWFVFAFRDIWSTEIILILMDSNLKLRKQKAMGFTIYITCVSLKYEKTKWHKKDYIFICMCMYMYVCVLHTCVVWMYHITSMLGVHCYIHDIKVRINRWPQRRLNVCSTQIDTVIRICTCASHCYSNC